MAVGPFQPPFLCKGLTFLNKRIYNRRVQDLNLASIDFGISRIRRIERLFVMDNTQRGKLILKTVPTGDVAKKVVRLLLEFAKTASTDELSEKVKNTPYTLSNDIEAEKAAMIVEAFKKCGATAVFISHEAENPVVEKPLPVKQPPVFSFDSLPAEEEAAPPIQMKPKKNGARRFTMLLVIILLFLSIGYLAWQLWPILGVKFQELINFLKNNI